MLRRLVLLLLCLINRPTRVLSTLQRGGGENRTLVEMNCEPEFFGGWGNVPGLSELEGCDGHADATSSHGWEEADVFGEPMCFIGGWDAVPVEPVPRGPVAHGGRPEKRRADRKAASNKQPRRLGAVAAEHGALGMIRQAGGGMVNCSKSCPDQKCAQRIVNSVPALELLQKQTWRHHSAIGEKHVAAAFVKEIRAAALPDTHPVRYALNVGNCLCCGNSFHDVQLFECKSRRECQMDVSTFASDSNICDDQACVRIVGECFDGRKGNSENRNLAISNMDGIDRPRTCCAVRVLYCPSFAVVAQ